MPGDYGYANARIRALKACLLDRQAYDSLIAAASVEALIQMLARTAHKPDVEAALLRYQGVQCLADALRRNLARTIGSMRRFFEGRARELVELLVARWDLFNLIAILRGQVRGVAAADILNALVPAGALAETELRELIKQPTIQATGELMLTWRLPFAGALAEALRRAGGELASVETRLHEIRFRDALSRLGPEPNDELVREMLETEIDVANLALLIRLSTLRGEAGQTAARSRFPDTSRMLIAGGRLPLHLLAELTDPANVETMVGRLAETPYGRALRQRVEPYRQSGDATALERALEEQLALKGIRMFYRDPLTIGMAIGFLWAKTTEAANLRLIAQGKELGWPVDEIRAQFFWWGRE